MTLVGPSGSGLLLRDRLLRYLGVVYLANRRVGDALPIFRRYVELAPKTPNAYDSLGLAYLAAGEHTKAIEVLDRALALAPNFDIALVHLGNVLFQMGRYREALAAYDRYIAAADFDADRGRGYACKAWVEFQRGNGAAAWRYAHQAVAAGGTHVEPLTIALSRGRTRAEQWYRAMLPQWATRGGRIQIRVTAFIDGHFALARGETEAALAHFSRATAAAPIYYHLESYEDALAEAYVAIGRHGLAIQEYQRVLTLNPRFARARFRLAQALERAGDSQRAAEEYRGFLDLWRQADRDLPEIRIAQRRIAALSSQ